MRFIKQKKGYPMEKNEILKFIAKAKEEGKGVLVYCSSYIFAGGKIQILNHAPNSVLLFGKDFQSDDSFIGPSPASCFPSEEKQPYVVPFEAVTIIRY
jgi:hypothetical protein